MFIPSGPLASNGRLAVEDFRLLERIRSKNPDEPLEEERRLFGRCSDGTGRCLRVSGSFSPHWTDGRDTHLIHHRRKTARLREQP